MVIAILLVYLFITPFISCGGGGSSSGNSNSIGSSSSSSSSNGGGVGGSSSILTGTGSSSSGGKADTPQPTLSSRIVHTKHGAVSGVIIQLEGRHLEAVEAFRGIPYASPPVGTLRFMPPVTGALWSGVKKADRFGAVCPQRLPNITNETAALERMPRGRLEYLKRLIPYLRNQSEDCLYLNIYSPIQAGSRDSALSGGGSGNSGSGSSSSSRSSSSNIDSGISSSSSGGGGSSGGSGGLGGGSGFSGSYGSSSSTSSGSSSNVGSGSSGGTGAGQTKYPVMVFVHGESYEWNSGNPYDGSVLASYGQILVVTINYRLGILGFLNANTDRYSKLPANYGLMDIIAALHWIKENIAAFGGDPQSITLAGHGTGAACVHFLISSSAVPEGLLFNRAILMSGSGLAPWSLVGNPSKYAAIVSHHVNCSPDLPHAHLMKCLRDKPLDQLLSVPIRPPEFGYTFGPSVDGVVIDVGEMIQSPSDSVLMRKSAINKLSRYDLLAGVTRAEAFFSFNSEDVQYGIEADRRSKILKSYVRNTYSYHLNEIFATIVNEYTDWERPVQHPINIRDETLEALSDAQVVAPAALTVDLHSADHRNSYLYVFDYQTKFGDFPQVRRQGCIHGEDLPYLFGAPLVGGLSHFTKNYTKAEINLSEIVMLYFSNFIRSGNPNEQLDNANGGGRQERGRYKTVEWTAYESVHKRYLNFDTKPKLKNHYRAHRLSFWLNLVPDLHKPGGDNVPAAHHQLEDDEIEEHVEPTVKPLNPPNQRDPKSSNYTIFTTQVFSLLNLSSPSSIHHNSTSRYNQQKVPSSSHDFGLGDDDQHGTSPPQEDGFAAYSTALSVTIAIGCSLLILNVLIFAGVYYQRDKTRLNEPRTHKKRNENGQMPNNICGDLETLTIHSKSDPATILGHHHALQHHQLPPPEFADLPQRAPPPPKHLKSVPEGSMIPPHALQMIGNQCGTLTKKSCMKQSSTNSGNSQNIMDELRV